MSEKYIYDHGFSLCFVWEQIEVETAAEFLVWPVHIFISQTKFLLIWSNLVPPEIQFWNPLLCNTTSFIKMCVSTQTKKSGLII